MSKRVQQSLMAVGALASIGLAGAALAQAQSRPQAATETVTQRDATTSSQVTRPLLTPARAPRESVPPPTPGDGWP